MDVARINVVEIGSSVVKSLVVLFSEIDKLSLCVLLGQKFS